MERKMLGKVDPTARIAEFGGHGVWRYSARFKHIFCKLCSTSCPLNRRSSIITHIKSKKHEEKLKSQFQYSSSGDEVNMYILHPCCCALTTVV
jgi:hypothetical protein